MGKKNVILDSGSSLQENDMNEQKKVARWLKDGKTKSWIARALGIPRSTLRDRIDRWKRPQKEEEPTPEVQAQEDRTLLKLKDHKRVTDKKYKALISEVNRLEKELDVALASSGDPGRVKIPATGKDKSEAVCFMIASDWHLEESVDAETVLHKNFYNLEEAERRAKLFFSNGLRLLKIYQKDVHVERVVLALLGDLITNYIHDEMMEINELAPADAIIFAEKIIVSGIEFLLEDKTIKRLDIPCHSGNHGRMTEKKRHATAEGNSIESILYHHIATYFKDEPRVFVHINKSYYSIMDIYDYKVRFHHGDAMRYLGGVGGLSIPVNKAIAQWDKMETVDLDMFGHFHQFLHGGKWISNGSLIGYNAYALSIKASYEPPRQACFLLDKNRGITFVSPILFN